MCALTHQNTALHGCFTRLRLLDADTQVPGDTSGALCPEVVAIAASTPVNGGNVAGDDFALGGGLGAFRDGRRRHNGPRQGAGMRIYCGRTGCVEHCSSGSR